MGARRSSRLSILAATPPRMTRPAPKAAQPAGREPRRQANGVTKKSNPVSAKRKQPAAAGTVPLVRSAAPHQTNAPLVSPESSRVVTPGAYEVFDGLAVSPSKGVGKPPTTTMNILDKACAHLISVEPRLKPLMEKYPCKLFSPEGLAEEIDPFRSLASGILAQQVRGKEKEGTEPESGNGGLMRYIGFRRRGKVNQE